MIDTHCHLHDRRYDGDRSETIARARDAGILQMLCVGCDLDDSARAVETARRFNLAASIGIHPHEANDAPPDIASAFESLATDSVIVAIGETGLDYYYDHSPREAQARAFRAQLRFARERRLPVIFHQRDAHEDFVAILRQEFVPPMRGVVHCFTGTAEQARTFTDEFGLTLGIGGVATFSNAQQVRDAVAAVGLGAIVLETDAPYLAPVPMRGKRNEPAFLPHVAAEIARVLDTNVANVITSTNRNARSLFGL